MVVSVVVIMGEVYYVWGLVMKMMLEIVRMVIEYKSWWLFYDKVVFNMWVYNKVIIVKKFVEYMKVVCNKDLVVYLV